MLVFPQWKPNFPGDGCRAQRWMNAERFAPYLARSIVLPPLPPQFEDDDSLGGSSPEPGTDVGLENKDGVCAWRGCGARFPNVARLSAHVARAHAHAHRDGLFYCGWKTCSRSQRGFNARYKMLVHVRTHTNERPHTCNLCNKSFSRAENLKIHLRSHSGEKPYICPYEGCGKAYSNSSDRFKHTRTHTIDKPYFCKVPGCNKRYTDPSSLRKHVKTYKHFTSEKDTCRESDDHKVTDRLSPQRDVTCTEHISPLHEGMYSPPKSIPSPQISPYDRMVSLENPLCPPYNYVPVIDQLSYVRPLEPVYPARIPTNEISYMEYSHMYDHAYRSYYLNNINYPVLRPSVREKVYTYEDRTQYTDVNITMDHVLSSPERITDDMPLNLMCNKHFECKPIEELVNIADLPLDLTTKS